MTKNFRLILIAVTFLCFGQHKTYAADTNAVTQAARKSAEELISLWRAGKWEAAATNVIVFSGKHDSVTRQRMGISKDATREEMTKKSAAWFERLYGAVRPGRVHDVEIDAKNQDVVLVTYTHDDLDGFTMRLVDRKWYYTLE